MAIKFTNFAYSTLAAGISGVSTTITLAGGTGSRFPTLSGSDYFYATLEDASLNREIVKVTARSTDTLTVVRGQDNTSARAWVTGDSIALRFNAAAISDALALLIANNIAGGANGSIPYQTAADTTALLAAGTAGQLLQTNGAGAPSWVSALASGTTATTQSAGDNSTNVATTAYSDAAVRAAMGKRNVLINGAFWINQRLPSTNADDTYAHDRWYALTQTGTVAVSTVTAAENTTPFMARLTQSQVTAQRMGYAQIIEGINCKHLRGQQVTFRFGRTRLSSSDNIRIAVLEWTGTEDSVTSDVVNSWTSTTYTAGNFFLASNVTVSSVVQQALTANTLTDGSSVTVTLGSSFNNLIVFAWTENAVAQNVTFDLAKAQLELGGVASAFEVLEFGDSLRMCQRYYEKDYNLATAPGTITTGYSATLASRSGGASDVFGRQFSVRKRLAPNMTVYSPNSGSSGNVRASAGVDRAVSSLASSEMAYTFAVTTSVAGESHNWFFTADAEL